MAKESPPQIGKSWALVSTIPMPHRGQFGANELLIYKTKLDLKKRTSTAYPHKTVTSVILNRGPDTQFTCPPKQTRQLNRYQGP
jgi:hypothetical protein